MIGIGCFFFLINKSAGLNSIPDNKISNKKFPKFKLAVSILMLLFGSILVSLYFVEFYLIYFNANPAGLFGREGKVGWIYQSPERYAYYCVTSGSVLLIPLLFIATALAKRSEKRLEIATSLYVFLSIAWWFIA